MFSCEHLQRSLHHTLHRRRACLIACLAACGLLATATLADELKLSRVSLFSSGVGYFEADGMVTGDATVELRFRTTQINDLLKSLVLQDFDGGTVKAVQYPSHDPIEKTLKSFGVDITGKPTLAQLLDQLRGVRVEVVADKTVSGMIVGVEKQQIGLVNLLETREVDVLTLLTDGGLRSFRLHELGGVKILDERVEAELGKALATLATSHDADRKTVVLNFAGQGKRHVRASYLLEAPIWKTSYRIELAGTDACSLQGWAIVENTTEEDWENVGLSLISGRPISFAMDLYTPLYVPRPVVELELYASLRPPEYEGAFDGVKAELQAGGAGRSVFGQGGPGKAGARGKDRRMAGRPRALAAAPYRGGGLVITDMAADGDGFIERELMLGEAGVSSIATTEEAGELFRYDIATPVSLKRRQSAMLPIVTAQIEAEKLSVYNAFTHAKYPLNAVKIKNTTDLNLMQGPVTLFEDNTYAGDAKLPDLRPGEERLLGYALDLAVEVNIERRSKPDEVMSLRIAKGTLWIKRKYIDAHTYTVKNKDDEERTIVLEEPSNKDWTLIEPKKPFERTANMLRFKVNVPPGKSERVHVKQERYRDTTVHLMSTGAIDIRIYLKMRVISDAVKRALEELVARRTALDNMSRRRQEAEREINTIGQEQARIRENMRTLPQNSELYRRYLTKLDSQETRIESLRDQVVSLRTEENRLRTDLENYVLNLNIE